MCNSFTRHKVPQGLYRLAIAGGLLLIGAGCGAGANGTGSSDGQVFLDDPLSFKGSLSGKLVDSQTTRASTIEPGSAQDLPPLFDTDNTSVRFLDLAGNELLDPNGQPIGEVSVASDGSFQADDLPVGVDFTVCGDIGKDGDCDIESCVDIPSADGGDIGRLDRVRADPLTTMILAKFRAVLRTRGIDPRDLPISPATVVARIVDAYVHLFEEAGIDLTILLDDISDLTPDELARLFDVVIPAAVRAGMEIAEGNIRLALAKDLETIVLGVAEVFLRAGFPIADLPGPPDLGALAHLDGVITVSPEELFPDFDHPDEFLEGDFEGFAGDFLDGLPDDFLDLSLDGVLPDGFDGFPDDLLGGTGDILLGAEGPNQPFPELEVIYINTVVEPDRNFPSGFDDSPEGQMPPLPVLNDHLLVEMARLQQEGRRITLADLYDLLTSLDNGLGVRLTFTVHDPNFFGPPLTVFETADGRGKAISLEKLFFRLFEEGFHDLDPESFERREAELRALLRDLLGDTLPPTFARLFGAFTSDRIAGIEELSRRIRSALAHLPFSRSGPSAFYVVADGDPFRHGEDVSPVTIDADVSVDGVVNLVEYNESGNGAYFLAFTESTESDGIVELLVRETGRWLHGPRGPARLSMHDPEIFQPIDGQEFFDFVSEHGTFYPGINVSVIREEFIPEPIFHEPEFIEPEFSEPPPPDSELEFVDITEPSEEGILPDDATLPVDDLPPDDTVSVDSGLEDQEPAGSEPVEPTPEEPVVAQFIDEPGPGPNEQLFVLATGVGPGAEPVRVDYDGVTGIATYNPGGRHLLMFLPDSHETGLFALFNEDTGRPAGALDPTDFFQAPPERPDTFEDLFNDVEDFGDLDQLDDFTEFLGDVIDELLQQNDPFFDQPLLDEELPPSDGEVSPPDEELPPPEDAEPQLEVAEQIIPAQFEADAPLDEFIEEPPFHEEFPEPEFILVAAEEIAGLGIFLETFTHVFGTEVPNERYDPSGDPYFDDFNGNGEHDPDEVTAQFRPTLFDPADWRSTDIRFYYRRLDNGASITFEDIDWESPTPRTLDGVELVPRTFVPRLNAFRFGRPNTAINLLTAFAPPDAFDGTHALNRETKVDIFSAIAIINLVMDQVHNVEADVDLDGIGPLPRERVLMDAHLFVVPINDPFVLLIQGFRDRSVVGSN